MRKMPRSLQGCACGSREFSLCFCFHSRLDSYSIPRGHLVCRLFAVGMNPVPSPLPQLSQAGRFALRQTQEELNRTAFLFLSLHAAARRRAQQVNWYAKRGPDQCRVARAARISEPVVAFTTYALSAILPPEAALYSCSHSIGHHGNLKECDIRSYRPHAAVSVRLLYRDVVPSFASDRPLPGEEREEYAST